MICSKINIDSINLLKKQAAKVALEFIVPGTILGVGTGSTVNYFIEELAVIKHKIEAAVASSKASASRLQALGIEVIELNSVADIPVYIDGADEINKQLHMIKGGGGALTGEKIISSVAKKVVCIAHQQKFVKLLGDFPIAVEVIPIARSYVAREIVKLGGSPVYREGFISDYGNVILDVYNLNLTDLYEMETKLNNIVGTVCNGIFAHRPADILLLGTKDGVEKIFS